MPYFAPYISAYTSITKELLNEFTNPDKMEGLAAGKMTLKNLFIPFNSNVAALSRYLLSIAWIPVIVANNVAHTVPYTIKMTDAHLNVGDNSTTNGDSRIDGTQLNA